MTIKDNGNMQEKRLKCYLICGFVCLLFFSTKAFSQNAPSLPNRTLTVSATQALNFGEMTIVGGSSGGTVTVDCNGIRSSTGNVILLSLGTPAHQAIYEFKLCPGRSVTLSYPPTITLSGSNGGSLTLHLGETNLGPSGTIFQSNKGCDDTIYLSQGGTINIGSISSNPAGAYTGNFDITFVQQ